MLLTIDAGNTNITLGFFDGEKLCAQFRITTDYNRSRDEYGVLFFNFLMMRGIKKEEIEGIINALSFRYKQNEAFVSTFRIRAELKN